MGMRTYDRIPVVRFNRDYISGGHLYYELLGNGRIGRSFLLNIQMRRERITPFQNIIFIR